MAVGFVGVLITCVHLACSAVSGLGRPGARRRLRAHRRLVRGGGHHPDLPAARPLEKDRRHRVRFPGADHAARPRHMGVGWNLPNGADDVVVVGILGGIGQIRDAELPLRRHLTHRAV